MNFFLCIANAVGIIFHFKLKSIDYRSWGKWSRSAINYSSFRGFHFKRFPLPHRSLDRLYHLIVALVAFHITFSMFMIICHPS